MMTAQDVLNELRRRGMDVVADGDRLIVRPRERLDDPLREAIRQHKPDLLAILSRGHGEPGEGEHRRPFCPASHPTPTQEPTPQEPTPMPALIAQAVDAWLRAGAPLPPDRDPVAVGMRLLRLRRMWRDSPMRERCAGGSKSIQR